MFKLSKILKTITSIGFIAMLIVTYSYLINDTQVYLESRKLLSLNVESFFYYSLGIFVGLHLLFFLFERILGSIQNKKEGGDGFIGSPSFLSWLNTFAISVNILMISYVSFVGFLNSDSALNLMNYAYILYLGPILIIISLILLPVLFFKHR